MEDFDPAQLGSLTQEELNARLLAATLKQGSRSGEQAMLAQQMQLGSGGARKLGPRGRGIIGEINDAFGAAGPGMAQGRANEMMNAQRLKDQQFMASMLRGKPKPATPLGPDIDPMSVRPEDPANPYGTFPPGY
jgi:hypothetical protein